MEKLYFLRRRSAGGDILPLYYSRQQASRKLSYSEKWIHIIPVVVFLCMFFLWWFSTLENILLNNGGGGLNVVSEPKVKKHRSLNETRVDFALLATAAKPPYASISRMNQVGNQTAAAPANGAQSH